MSDTFNRVFTSDVAQCGCLWQQMPAEIGSGEMLVECTLHKQASDALYGRITDEMDFEKWLQKALHLPSPAL